MILIDGKALAEEIKSQVVNDVVALGDRPNLAIILVGEREDSALYVRLKESQAKEVGIDTHVYRFIESTTEAELIEAIEFLNNDEEIDALLLQLPLPEHFNTDKVVAAMDPAKDVDGFHPANLAKLMASCQGEIEPPLISVILEILKSIDFKVAGKKVVIVGNSDFLGSAVKHVLECQQAQVEIVLIDNFTSSKTAEADLLITAVGRPGLITADAIKQDVVIIDIGISKNEFGRVIGDVDADSVSDKAGYLTPVPGGVGPLTIAMAFKNTIKLYKNSHPAIKEED